MHLDGRGIELQFLPVNVSQFLHYALPNPLRTPTIKPTPDRIPIPKTFRQVPPRHAGLRNEQHRIDKQTVVLHGSCHEVTRLLWVNQVLPLA